MSKDQSVRVETAAGAIRVPLRRGWVAAAEQKGSCIVLNFRKSDEIAVEMLLDPLDGELGEDWAQDALMEQIKGYEESVITEFGASSCRFMLTRSDSLSYTLGSAHGEITVPEGEERYEAFKLYDNFVLSSPGRSFVGQLRGFCYGNAMGRRAQELRDFVSAIEVYSQEFIETPEREAKKG